MVPSIILSSHHAGRKMVMLMSGNSHERATSLLLTARRLHIECATTTRSTSSPARTLAPHHGNVHVATQSSLKRAISHSSGKSRASEKEMKMPMPRKRTQRTNVTAAQLPHATHAPQPCTSPHTKKNASPRDLNAPARITHTTDRPRTPRERRRRPCPVSVRSKQASLLRDCHVP
jgi:hypothetical protein